MTEEDSNVRFHAIECSRDGRERMKSIFELAQQTSYSKEDIIRLLSVSTKEEKKKLLETAYRIKVEQVGAVVYFRGLIEVSNACDKDCFYCGIRKGNRNVERYRMSEKEILEEARQSWEWGYGSIVLQSGELEGTGYTSFIENIIRKIKDLSHGELGITLSLGEQSDEVYQRWFDAGAHRYLLRIETIVTGKQIGRAHV